MKILIFSLLVGGALVGQAYANDSTGYVATGGVSYIKNDKIAMHSEDLYISKDLIKVDYKFKNLSNQPVTETLLFPLPPVPTWTDYDFADVNETLKSFKTMANGKAVKYKTHVRAFMYDKDEKAVDVTQIFNSCGVSEQEMLRVWEEGDWLNAINQKLVACDNAKLKSLMGEFDPVFDQVLWDGQVIYEFEQTFAPHATTKISHSYQPMVGGSVHFHESQYAYFCVDKSLAQRLNKRQAEEGIFPYSALGYVLTTGANWAKPIEQFKLTIERDSDEIVSFCWNGKSKVQKVGAGKFEVIERNFVPKHDLDVAFVKLK